ncbi:MAG: hypothetical protein LBG52_06580 [Candidatus Peribacteria bacterium]|jgi:hypothetical protein|nr:hypothetical protein [Candidatus Peribacteria bacterium]
MIFADVKESIKKFQKQAIIADDDEAIQRRSDTDKSNIKLWMDETLTINRMLKYFVTQANKRK